jgi:hypothetical protein
MPIDASPAGTLDIENATLRSREIVALTNMVAGNDVVRSGGPALEVYGDPSNGGNEATLQLVSNTANTISTSFTSLTSNAGVLSVKTGTDASDNGTITFGGFSNERLRITSDGKVGVGTTSPNTKLNVKSGVFLSENQASTNGLVLYYDGGGSGGSDNNQYNLNDSKFGTGIFVNDTGTTGSTITLMNKEGADNTTKHASIGFVLSDITFNGKFGGQIGFWPEDINAIKQQFRIYTSGTSAGYNLPVQQMVVTGDGNVGIGYSNPLGKLYIAADYNHTLQRPSTSSNHYLVLSKTGAQVVDEGPGISFCGSYSSSNDYQDVMAEIRGICDTDGGRRGRLEFWTSSADGINDVDTQAMTIKSNGNVGIGTVSPDYQKLQIYDGGLYIQRSGTHSPSRDHDANKWITLRRSGNKVSGEGPGISFQGSYYLTADFNNHLAMIKATSFNDNNTRSRLEFLVNDGEGGGSSLSADDLAGYFDYDSNGGQVNFTGQHRTFIKDVPFGQAGDLEGLIVSSDQNKYIKMDGGIETGSNAITISEALPVVSLSTKTNDKKCFGVISASEDPENREDRYGRLFCHFKKELGDTRVYINSVGEGAIWITNINGSLESGDYITTSNIVGYGQKQDSDSLKNYTVAKITMDCDFDPVTQPVQIIKKELQDVNYWVKTTYETITEGEYSILPEKERRMITETVYTNDDGETFTEQNEQSTYTERIRTIYQKIHEEKSKNEKKGYEFVDRREIVNVLDEHGQLQWEDDPSGATEKAYKIRYLDANGNITDEANHVYKAAFVGCTYHCG